MRKTIISAPPATPALQPGQSLDLEALAHIHVTSEHPDFPIEGALLPDGAGWRAAAPGRQTLRLVFDAPQPLRLLRLVFVEPAVERTQEFQLAWSSTDDGPLHEIVRQQYHFSPAGSTRELEEYSVNLDAVKVLQLEIDPDRGRDQAAATLLQMQLY